MQTNSSTEPYPDPDVLIIGAGPTGAVASKRLAEAGFKVVCLEQGDWPDYTKARAAADDYELTAGRDWNWTPNNRRMPSDYPIEESASDITALMWNGVGGSSVLFAAQWHRNLPSDFCVRSLDGVADDWPLTYAELEPFYERVENDFAISGVAGDPAYPKGTATLLPPAPLGRIGRRVVKAHNELGWHWWPSSNAIATRAHGRLRPCVQRATCLWGCPEGAKASADRSHWPINLELGVRLITGARVQRIEMDAQGRATGATYIDRAGQQHFQAAPVTIVAANGVGTPRLLFASATDRYREGLANSSATPFHALIDRAALKSGETVAIFGAGGLGLHAVQIARLAGARYIIAVDVREEQLERARKVGANTTINPRNESPVDAIMDATAGRGVDVAAEFVGLQATIAQAVEAVAAGGRVVVSGLGPEPITIVPPTVLVRKEISLMGSYAFTKQTIERLMDLVASGKLALEESVTHTFPLDEVNQGLDVLQEKIGNPTRVVITLS